MTEEEQNVPMFVFYLGLLIVNAIAGILILATDFGGFYYYTGSLYIWNYVNLLNPIAAPFILIAAVCFFYSVYFSIIKLLKKEEYLPPYNFNIGFSLSIVALILVILGAIAVVIIGIDATEWWFDAGFYGGFIGGILNLLLYVLIKLQ